MVSYMVKRIKSLLIRSIVGKVKRANKKEGCGITLEFEMKGVIVDTAIEI